AVSLQLMGRDTALPYPPYHSDATGIVITRFFGVNEPRRRKEREGRERRGREFRLKAGTAC
ncbi:hypothetical protein, partial [Microcoleus sp. herbarium14]|uniref:hypothetical protein n=1 Tax=Microcoleus sp. herbarium14 TaxID=3055439 RepID=UPI002FD792D0